MVRQNPEIQRLTLKIRDALRVVGWQIFRNNEDLAGSHTEFYSRWNVDRVHQMEYGELQNLLDEMGCSMAYAPLCYEEVLEIRRIYYGLANASQ
ncbi:hypothetical protein [Microcoleus sp. bin38.metabat.b11b12b14.051]|uniref:hypothetical protein n=1 Tax=Microcoleus sp. bin38.metabat.b11b12b14.051 TaxID=2742709 RepID=UPI0025EB64BB|nr:hypothetical protein [Microcoleus sp. bin38.metabat.b11b12b14.051]